MKIKELIEELQKHPMENEVSLYNDNGEGELQMILDVQEDLTGNSVHIIYI
jgi:hypothetical protein